MTIQANNEKWIHHNCDRQFSYVPCNKQPNFKEQKCHDHNPYPYVISSRIIFPSTCAWNAKHSGWQIVLPTVDARCIDSIWHWPVPDPNSDDNAARKLHTVMKHLIQQSLVVSSRKYYNSCVIFQQFMLHTVDRKTRQYFLPLSYL